MRLQAIWCCRHIGKQLVKQAGFHRLGGRLEEGGKRRHTKLEVLKLTAQGLSNKGEMEQSWG